MTQPAPDVIEHRLALVMNGGVSLAVWMGGVAQEIDTLRRASNGFAPPLASDPGDLSAAAERKLFEKWAEVAKGVNTRFTVDVIAGTSAGGLNGVLLAAAIAKGVPLAGLRELWMTAPALRRGRLLPTAADPTSILDGDYFHNQITAALAALSEAAAQEPADPPEAKPADVSLTVTATALGGQPRSMTDRNGTRFLEQDHRRRYRFRRVGTQYRYEDGGFPSDCVDDLASDDELSLAARATASFPAAFSPVRETWRLRKLRVWPTWRTDVHSPEYLADGGILDNSPFGTVLDAIAAQPVEAQWERTLCYIVPSADEVGHDLAPTPDVPPPWTAVVGAALGDAREADLRDDVEQMHALVRAGRTTYDLDRLRLLLGAPLPAVPPAVFGTARDLAIGGFDLFRAARAAAAVYDALDVAGDALPDAYLDPQVRVKPAEVVRRHDPADVTGQRPWVADAFPTSVPTTWTWTWGVSAAGRLVSLLLRFLADDDDVSAAARRKQLSTLTLQLAAVRVALGDGIRAAVKDQATIPDPIAMAAILDEVFTRLDVPATVGGLVEHAVTTFAKDRYDVLHVLQAALCVEVVNGAGGAPVDLQTRPVFKFLRLGISAQPRKLRAAFDPRAGEVRAPLADILYGSRLSHFAAFGREQWRAWDWMWGRLHAAVQLGTLMGLSDDTVDEIVKLILAAENTTLNAVRADIPKVLALEPATLIDKLADDGAISPTIDAVIALLASDARTQPPAPHGLTKVAKWLRHVGHFGGKVVEHELRD